MKSRATHMSQRWSCNQNQTWILGLQTLHASEGRNETSCSSQVTERIVQSKSDSDLWTTDPPSWGLQATCRTWKNHIRAGPSWGQLKQLPLGLARQNHSALFPPPTERSRAWYIHLIRAEASFVPWPQVPLGHKKDQLHCVCMRMCVCERVCVCSCVLLLHHPQNSEVAVYLLRISPSSLGCRSSEWWIFIHSFDL